MSIPPVEEGEPEKHAIEACIDSDPLRAQFLARQKIRAMTKRVDKYRHKIVKAK